jgi:hypothetical protein
MLRDKIFAAVRTAFAALGVVVVTWVVAQLANLGVIVKVDETWSTVLAGAAFAVFIGVYNFAVQWLTENVWDGFGWLLGVNKAPAYVDQDLRTQPDEDGDNESVAVDAAVLDEPGGVMANEGPGLTPPPPNPDWPSYEGKD